MNNGKPDMLKLSYDFMANSYIYAANLRAKGHASLGERLINQALDLDCETHFIKTAFTSDEFADHLKKAYYAVTRAVECLRLVAAVGVKCDKHTELLESADNMQRMLKSSVVTVLSKKNAIQRKPDNTNAAPVVTQYREPSRTDYVKPQMSETPEVKHSAQVNAAEIPEPPEAPDDLEEFAPDLDNVNDMIVEENCDSSETNEVEQACDVSASSDDELCEENDAKDAGTSKVHSKSKIA